MTTLKLQFTRMILAVLCQLVLLILFKAKVGMLDNLLDIEVAYSLLKSGEADLVKDPLDVNYEKLQTDLEVNNFNVQVHLLHTRALAALFKPRVHDMTKRRWRNLNFKCFR